MPMGAAAPLLRGGVRWPGDVLDFLSWCELVVLGRGVVVVIDLLFVEPLRWRICEGVSVIALLNKCFWIRLLGILNLFLAGRGGEEEKGSGARQLDRLRQVASSIFLALSDRGGRGRRGWAVAICFCGGPAGGFLCWLCSGRPWRRGEQSLPAEVGWRWWCWLVLRRRVDVVVLGSCCWGCDRSSSLGSGACGGRLLQLSTKCGGGVSPAGRGTAAAASTS